MPQVVLLKQQSKLDLLHGGHSMSNNIIIVHRPNLTEEERAKRMEEIKRAAVQLVIAAERLEQERK